MTRGKPIPEDVRQRVLDKWIQGFTYRKIQQKTGVGLATAHQIVRNHLKKEPDLSELRALNKALQKSEASFIECLRGAGLLEELNNYDVSLNEIGDILKFVKKVKNPLEAARAGLEIERLKEKTGKGYDELLEEYRSKEENLVDLDKQLNNKKRELKQVRSSLEDAEALSNLQKELKILSLTPERLQKFVMNAKEVEENGFTPEISAILSKEIKKQGLDPARAAVHLAELVSKHKNLRYAVDSLVDEEVFFKRRLTTLESEKSRLEKSINAKREKIRELDNTTDDRAQKISSMNTTIEDLENEKKETEEVLGAMKDQIEATNAWRSYLLSGKILSWESTFWQDLNQLLLMRNRGITDEVYLMPASEAVQKKMVELYREMVKKGLGDIWDAFIQMDMRALEDRLERETNNSKALEEELANVQEELKTREETFETRIQEEVSNRLSTRIATKKCSSCGGFFWIDTWTDINKKSHYCPYCIYMVVGNFPYNIYHYPKGKTLITAYLPNQKNEDILIETRASTDQNWMVWISTKDGSHFITVPLYTRTEPSIQEKIYENGQLHLRLKIEMSMMVGKVAKDFMN